jgi:hypothetical protein
LQTPRQSQLHKTAEFGWQWPRKFISAYSEKRAQTYNGIYCAEYAVMYACRFLLRSIFRVVGKIFPLQRYQNDFSYLMHALITRHFVGFFSALHHQALLVGLMIWYAIA